MPLIRYFNHGLENKFIVVNWDQRGTGKSLFFPMNARTMNMSLILDDLHQLVGILKKRFNKDKIFLAGHSWGSILGLYSIKKYPEDYHAYIGIGQVVCEYEACRLTYQFCYNRAIESDNKSALKELQSIELPRQGSVPGWNDSIILYKWLHRFNVAFFKEKNFSHLNRVFFESKEYSLIDLIRKKIGIGLSLLFLQDEMARINFFIDVDNFEIPVFFCIGRHDYQTPYSLVEKYCNHIKAPYKELIWFEKSAHYPLFEEPDRFDMIMSYIHGLVINGKNDI